MGTIELLSHAKTNDRTQLPFESTRGERVKLGLMVGSVKHMVATNLPINDRTANHTVYMQGLKKKSKDKIKDICTIIAQLKISRTLFQESTHQSPQSHSAE